MPRYLVVEDNGPPTAQLFGQRLKERRKALKMSQTQLFERTGITAAYISLVERSRANPTLDMMVKIAEAVGSETWEMIRPPSGG